MARRKTNTAGAADSVGGVVTSAQLELARQQPEINATVAALQPFSNIALGVVRSLEVRNETDKVIMADVLRQIKTAMATADDKFDPIIDPMNKALNAARAWRKEVKGPLEAAEVIAKEKIGDYEVGLVKAADAQRQLEMRQVAPQVFSPVFAPMGHLQQPQPPTPTPTPTPYQSPIWHNPAATLTAAPVAGITTKVQWTVEVQDDKAATLGLIASGAHNLLGLGVAALFVRVDVSALRIAVRDEGPVGEIVRTLLSTVPGLSVVHTASTTARQYE